MPFLRNAWYAAAWEDEVVAGALFHRRFLNEEVLLVRDAAGTAHAGAAGLCLRLQLTQVFSLQQASSRLHKDSRSSQSSSASIQCNSCICDVARS